MEIPESFEVRLHDLSHRVFTFGDANKIQEFSMHWTGAIHKSNDSNNRAPYDLIV